MNYYYSHKHVGYEMDEDHSDENVIGTPPTKNYVSLPFNIPSDDRPTTNQQRPKRNRS